MSMQKDGVGQCNTCGFKFSYQIVHNGFGDTAYAYCDSCGMTALVGGWDDNKKPPEAPLKIQGPIQQETERWLRPCECGGRFRADSSPRCPRCRSALSAEGATAYIEKNAPGTRKGWRWQQSWRGTYCLIIEGRLVSNNWGTEPEPLSDFSAR
ncbi:MAG: hypothetical protein QOE68_3548 [Thermoanaerobaculia bacterium]|nr:hypothetical protein [Thermoanaerobaculia bacterium]